MGFAEEKVKEYVMRHYCEFHSMRVSQLLDFLPCLTAADRQEIRAFTDRKGEISSVQEFFDRLWCRSGWVTQLISALERNESNDLAKVIRNVYEAAQLPHQSPPAASSPPDVAQHSQLPVSVPVGPRAPSPDAPPLSLPRSQPRPARVPLHTGVNALTPAPSASLQDVVDCRSPVQETKFALGSNETAIDAKVCGNDIKQRTSTPEQCNRNATDSDPSLAVRHDHLTDVQAAFPRSMVQHQMPLGEASEEEMQSATRISSRSDAGNSVRNWDGFQPRPVCVKNGYFGNVSRSVDIAVSPASEPAASSALPASGNQPEENSYLSADSSLLTPGGQDGVRAEEQRTQPLWGYQQDDRLDNLAVNKPSLQMRVNAEQRGAQGQQDSTSKASAAPLLQKEGDIHTRQIKSMRADFRAVPSDASPTGGAPTNLLRRGATRTPSIPSETRAANFFEQDSPSECSEEVSHDHRWCHKATPGSCQLCQGNTIDQEIRGPFVPETPRTASSLGRSPSGSSQFPQRLSRKERVGPVPNTVLEVPFRSPPSDFAGCSSTDVIPPSSPAAISGTLSDDYHEVLKPPVQERQLHKTTPEKMTGDVPSGATVVQASNVMDTPANSRVNKNNISGSSRLTCVFYSNHEEEDVSLVKPGVLVSEKTTGNLDHQLSDGDEEYSGMSDRFRFSSDFSAGSDPLMLSDSTQGSRSEDSGKNALNATSSPPLHHWDDDDSDGGSIRTHTVCVGEPPSVDLTGAPEITRPALGNASQPPGHFMDSIAGDQLIRRASSRPVCNDGRRNSSQNESVGDTVPCHRSDSTLLAVGFALASLAALAFVLYKQSKK